MSTPSRRRRGLVALAVLLVALALAPKASATQEPVWPVVDRPQVAVFGDSLAWEAQDYVRFFAGVGGMQATTYVAGGTAICDFFPEMEAAAATHPQAVVVAFSGNSLTPCMTDADGHQLWGDPLFAKYAADVATTVALFPRSLVYLVGAPPPQRAQPGDPQVADVYRAAAGVYTNARFVDGGALITPGGRWSKTEPCLPFEPCVGPLLGAGKVNVVRAPDGGHFCPVSRPAVRGVVQTCPVYSSGAMRYALTMVDAVARQFAA